ncbi:MAG: hypothetical protein J6S27_03785 [Thermoguttaceae bacterium]|nr:hypothetical protein [Thermoguttaceae bacterium]
MGGPALTADELICESVSAGDNRTIGNSAYAVTPLAIAAKVLAPEVEAMADKLDPESLESRRANDLSPYCAAVENDRLDWLTLTLVARFGDLGERLMTPEINAYIGALSDAYRRHIINVSEDELRAHLTYEAVRLLAASDYQTLSPDELYAYTCAVVCYDPQVEPSFASTMRNQVNVHAYPDAREILARARDLWESRVERIFP